MHIDFKSVRARLSRIASLGSQAEKLTNEVLAIVAESREGHVSLHEVEQAVETAKALAYAAGHAEAKNAKLDAAGVVTKQDATDLVNAGRAAAKDAVIAAVQKVADDHSGAVVKGALNKALDAAKAVSLIESALTDSDTSAPISPGAKGDAS